jgi:protein-tyrosine phosphatase
MVRGRVRGGVKVGRAVKAEGGKWFSTPAFLECDAMRKVRILFVCMGNICRSPSAEGVMRKLIDEAGLQEFIEIDSAGTSDYHIGAAPDSRSQEAALRRGYDLAALRARQVSDDDFRNFDFLVAMDKSNLTLLQRRCPPSLQGKLHLMMQYAERSGAVEVPDPYYEGAHGFEMVLDYLEDACSGLLRQLRAGKGE